MKKELRKYQKKDPYWNRFLTDEQIVEEYKKRGFVRQTAMECHVNRARVSAVIKAEGLT